MPRLRLGLTRRQAHVVRGIAIACVMMLSISRDRQEMARMELLRLGPIRVSAATDGGTELIGRCSISVGRPSVEGLRTYLPLLTTELSVYPDQVFRTGGLREVVICGRLTVDGKSRMATYDLDQGILYVVATGPREQREYGRKLIHHEFFHMIDFNDDGRYADPKWERLNEPGFRYGSGGETMQSDPAAGLPDVTLAGFLNTYSRSGVEEDKAEIFAYMMTDPKLAEARGASDPIISAKLREMARILQRFCPSLDERFWTVVRGHG
jgi:hypothetical protein